MKIRKILSILTALVMIFALTSCGESYKDAFIYIEFNSKAQTLDPQLVTSLEETTIVRSIFDTLLRYDENGHLMPSAAENYTVNGNTYTFNLRKDAKWTNGEAVTAKDFVFAFRRAIDPETKAPYANTLFPIKNAREINSGKLSLSQLGVKAIDDYTFEVTLTKSDKDFTKVFATPITMPCNQSFFNKSKGKYGLTVDTTASNGSYYVRVWNTESTHLIRLAKNLDYSGPFEANSMRVYFTCSEKDNLKLLEDENTDISYLSTEEYIEAQKGEFNFVSTEDTCYTLFINKNLAPQIREALLKSIDSKSHGFELIDTQRNADTLFPACLEQNNITSVNSYINNDNAYAQELFGNYVKAGNKVNRLIIKYPDNATAETVTKTLAAHWQLKLSCFMNIESNSPASIKNQYKYGDYDIIVVPLTSSNGILSSYISEIGIDASTANAAHEQLYGNYLSYPLYYSSTSIGAISEITNLKSSTHNGIIDVSQLIKN